MRLLKWWQAGLLGAALLLILVLVKALIFIGRFFTQDVPWSELPGFAALLLFMGFTCGLVVWLVLPLSGRYGAFGDVIVGVVGTVFFFLMCMIAFDRAMLTTKPIAGAAMFVIAIVTGAVLGPWIGRDLRKEIAKERRKQGR